MALIFYTERIEPLDIDRARIDAGVAYFEQHRFALPLSGKPTAAELLGHPEHDPTLKMMSDALRESDGTDDLPRSPLRFLSLVDPDFTAGSAIPTWLSQLLDAPAALCLLVSRGTVETASGERLSRGELVARHTGQMVQLRGVGGLVRLDDRRAAFELLARPEFRNSAVFADPTPDLVEAHASGASRALLFSGFSRGVYIHFTEFHQIVSSCRWLMVTHRSEPVVVSVYTSQAHYEEVLALLDAHSPRRVHAPRNLPRPHGLELPPPYRVVRMEPEGLPLEYAEHLIIQARGRLDDLLACRSLRHLVVDHGSIWLDRATIARLPQLRSLSVKGVTVRDLDFLVPLGQLETLCISRLPSAGVDEFGKLAALRSFEVQDSPLSSLAFVTKLSRLETLHVDRLRHPDRSLHSLAGHPCLHSVIIPEPDLTSIDPLATLRVRRFETWNSKVSNLGPLAGKQSLLILRLQNTRVRDLTPLSGLQNLLELWLLGCRIRDLTPLADCPALRLLDLQCTVEVDWAGLARLTHLETLYLQSSEIADLEPLSALRGLRTLDVGRTEIRSLAPLAALQSLEELVITKTAVRDLTPLTQLPRLRRLVIDADQVDSASRTGLSVEIDTGSATSGLPSA